MRALRYFLETCGVNAAKTRQLSHWRRRWTRRKVDWYMGRCLVTAQKEHARLIWKHLRPASLLDVGAGCWKFLEALRPNVSRLAGTELPVAVARVPPPPGVEAHVSDSPWPLPWPDKSFDVAYQNNAVATMATDDIPRVIEEMCRVAKFVAWGEGYEPRFWVERVQGDSPPWCAASAWLLARLFERATLLIVWPQRLTIWKPR